MRLAARGLKQVDDGNRNFRPAELPAGFQSALPRDQSARGRYHDRMQQTDLGNTVGKSSGIAHVFPIAKTNLYFFNSHQIGDQHLFY